MKKAAKNNTMTAFENSKVICLFYAFLLFWLVHALPFLSRLITNIVFIQQSPQPNLATQHQKQRSHSSANLHSTQSANKAASMAAATALKYSQALRKQLGDAGLQGAVQADAFKMLLQYMSDSQADTQVMALVLEQLKQGEWMWVGGCGCGICFC